MCQRTTGDSHSQPYVQFFPRASYLLSGLSTFDCFRRDDNCAGIEIDFDFTRIVSNFHCEDSANAILFVRGGVLINDIYSLPCKFTGQFATQRYGVMRGVLLRVLQEHLGSLEHSSGIKRRI